MSRSRARSRGRASALQGVEGRSMTLTLCPAMAVSGPIHSLPGEQAGWTDGWGVWLRTDPQSRLPSNQGEVATLLTEGSRVPSPLAILFCLLLPLFFFFLPSPDAGVGGGFVSNWFQEAGARPLFFQSKAEMVRIRTSSVKSILRGSVCTGRMGAGPQHHHLTFEPFPRTRGRELHSAKFPWPQSGSRRAQGKP